MDAGTVKTMEEASEQQIVRCGRVLTTLAAEHGLTNLRRAGDGHVVADIAQGRTYFDVASFELQAKATLGAKVDVLFADTPSGVTRDNGPLIDDQVA